MNQKKPELNFGTIGHTETNKSDLSEEILKYLEKKGFTTSNTCETFKDTEESVIPLTKTIDTSKVNRD